MKNWRQKTIGLALMLALAACGNRATIAFDAEAARVGTVVPIFVATNRHLVASQGTFDGDRSEELTFGRFDVSVPPERTKGEIPFQKTNQKTNPRTQFVVSDSELKTDPNAFRADLAAALRTHAPGDRDTVLYVHGYNNTFADGLYRLAQLSHDLSLPGVPVYFSWPSQAKPLGYVADRDSAAISRDGLELLIREVEAAGSENIILVAHSMGCLLVMEALRQIAIRGDKQALDRIGGVILLSPDLDVDFFRSQVRTIGALPQPFLIYGSSKDKILNISAKLTGQSDRLGNLDDVGRIADINVTYIDVSAFSEGSNHFVIGDDPTLIGLLSQVDTVRNQLEQPTQSPAKKRAPEEENSFVMFEIAREIIITPTTAPIPLVPDRDSSQ